MKLEQSATLLEKGVSRRSFLKLTSTLAAGTAFAGVFFRVNEANAANFGNPVLVDTDPRMDIKYSVCQGCHGRCGLKAKVVDGVLVKIEGSPYHPCNLEQHLTYATDPATVRAVSGRMCAKGLGGTQSLYDPHRLKQPLKRVGERGAGQWEAISWEQAFSEIAAKLVLYRDLSTPIEELAKLVKALIVTMGAGGSVIHTGGQQIVIPCVNAKELLDPTGCGDAFRAGLLYGIAAGLDWPLTGRLASLMGAIKIASRGGQNHHFTRDEIAQRFKESFGNRIW